MENYNLYLKAEMQGLFSRRIGLSFNQGAPRLLTNLGFGTGENS
jgi:hypothetical protein